MKNILILLIGILIATPALTASGDAPFTFTVRNNTYEDVDIVLLNHNSGSPDSLDVSGYGTYGAQVDSRVPSVTINGQTVNYPTVGLVTLDNGTVVKVSWQSAVVVFVDTNEL
jgi:hypothetical protein